MNLGVRAQESSLSDIFAPGEKLRMPAYQRSYSWTDREALDLLNDLLDAAETNLPHFIGAVVFVHGEEPGLLEIVDGQQRLTTLTILLCVLRDLETDPERSAALQKLIADNVRPMLGEGANWRLALNYQDGPFFRDTIQTPGATVSITTEPDEIDSQARMAGNALAFVSELRELTDDKRRALTEIVVNGCAIVRVVVDNKDQGFKVFRVLNTRGKEPDAHDIIKTELFQRAKLSAQDADRYGERWAEHEAALGGPAFDDLLRQIRSVYDRSPKGDLVAGFQKAVLQRVDPRVFLDQILPQYVSAYLQVETATFKGAKAPQPVIDSLHQLRALEQQNWRAPAIQFLVERGIEDPAAPEYYSSLERLAYVLQLVVQDRDQRIRRFLRVSDAIKNDRVLFSKSGPFAISREEGKRVRERLLGRFGAFGQRRSIALRLNAAIAGGRTVPPESDATVEHVLPRNLTEDSHWMVTWPDPAKRREQCDTIGNFVLLTHKVNQKADRLDYRAKKDIYFNGGGGGDYALTRDLMNQDAWTPEIVRKRTEILADILAKTWDL